jgi:hypothetical protein
MLKKSHGCVGSVLGNGPPSCSAAAATALEKLIIISTVIRGYMMMIMRNKTILVIGLMAILSIGLMQGTTTTRMMTAAGSTDDNNNTTSEFADYTIVIRDPATGEEEEITSTEITHERCREIVKSFEEDGYDVTSNKSCEPDDSSSSDDT